MPSVTSFRSVADLLHRYLQSAEVEGRRESDLGASHFEHNAIRVLQAGCRRTAGDGKARANRCIGACNIAGPAQIARPADEVGAANADHADAHAAKTQRVTPAMK